MFSHPKQAVSVVIPALNEEAAIVETVDQIRSTLRMAGIEHEIIVVNDGSTDKTGDLARQAGARVIDHPHPGGYGQSLKDGIRHASHPLIAITDADGTYPIKELPTLLKEMQYYDMVIGARTGAAYRGTLLKYPARKMFLWLCEFVTGRRIPDINSGLRVFTKEGVMPYFETLCGGFSFTTTITLAYMLNGKFLKYIPIEYYKRIGSSKVRYFRDTLQTTQIIVQAILYYNPIKLFLLLAATALLPGIAALIAAFFLGATYLIITMISFVGALILFGIGLLADLMRKQGS